MPPLPPPTTPLVARDGSDKENDGDDDTVEFEEHFDEPEFSVYDVVNGVYLVYMG
jgi:hypothetical protein